MDDKTRLLLRVELVSKGETVVTYARALTETTIFVVTESVPPVGTDLELRVSFPTLLDPVTARGRVVEHHAEGGLGDPAGVQLSFELDSDAARAALAGIVRRLQGTGETGDLADRTFSVLLVEDNLFIRDMFAYGVGKFFRQRSGTLHFDHAEDAPTARLKLAEGNYDLVIVDYYLPAEDGATLIAKLRKDEKFAKVPVVAISVGGRDARDATISAGADLFLDKPVVLRDLFNMLQALAHAGRPA